MVLVLVIGDLHIPLRTHDIPAKFKKLLVPGKIQQILCTGNVCDRETWDYLRGVAPDVRGVRGEYDDNPALPQSLVVQHGPLRVGLLHGHQVVPLGDTEALSAVARKMDVDVLISGATHKFEAFEYDSRFFINPGSASGAFTPFWTPGPAVAPPIVEPTAEGGGAEGAESKPTAEGEIKKEDSEKKAEDGAEKDKKEDDDSARKEPAGPIPSFALLDIQGTVVVTYVYQLVDDVIKVEKLEQRLKQ